MFSDYSISALPFEIYLCISNKKVVCLSLKRSKVTASRSQILYLFYHPVITTTATMMMKSTARQRQHTALTLLLLLRALSTSTSFSIPPRSFVSTSPIRTTSGSTKHKFTFHAPNRHGRSTAPLASSSNIESNQDDDNDNPSSTTTTANNNRSSSKPRRTNKPPKDLYAILGATPTMTKSEIKQCYISLAKQTHPDSSSYNNPNNINGDDDSSSTTSTFSEISSAYKILSDSKLRRRYDRTMAAEEFKGDVVAYASEVAKEYGPVARKLYEDWALPLLKRTTAGTVAGLSVIGEVTTGEQSSSSSSSSTTEREEMMMNGRERTRVMGGGGRRENNGGTLSELVSEMTELERRQRQPQSNNGNRRALEDFGKAFQRVIEAGRNATRQIDGAELQEKSVELRQR